jgi:DNA repair protein RadA/Sms
VGFCPQCKGRGSIRELGSGAIVDAGESPRSILDAAAEPAPRRSVAIGEVDHVLGGGLVDGAVLLLGGEPGVGKSTLLLQLAAGIAADSPDPRVLIATGEESAGQISMRAERIGASAAGVDVAATRRVDVVAGAVDSGRYRLVIVDSIQTMVAESVDGSAGGVGQVRECTSRLIESAKRSGTPVVLVGHVTKEGSLAGPKMIEHMVDVVLHLDGGDVEGLRFLRCLKNRYGSTDRVGVFEMTDEGMREVPDPVGCLVADWGGAAEGTVLFPSVNGKRPMLIEVQALVTASRGSRRLASIRSWLCSKSMPESHSPIKRCT